MKANIGIVIISHEQIGERMLEVVNKIVGAKKPIQLVNMPLDAPSDLWRDQLSAAIKAADSGNGVLLLADVYGATPFNICKSFVQRGKVALVAGFNMPMLLKLAAMDNGYSAPETLAQDIRDYGQKHIILTEDAE